MTASQEATTGYAVVVEHPQRGSVDTQNEVHCRQRCRFWGVGGLDPRKIHRRGQTP